MDVIFIDNYNDPQVAISSTGEVIPVNGSNNEVLSGVIPESTTIFSVPVERYVHGQKWAVGGMNTAGSMYKALRGRGIFGGPNKDKFKTHY